jgi:hypothetical protein
VRAKHFEQRGRLRGHRRRSRCSQAGLCLLLAIFSPCSRALECLLTEVARVRLHGFTDKEYERAVRNLQVDGEVGGAGGGRGGRSSAWCGCVGKLGPQGGQEEGGAPGAGVWGVREGHLGVGRLTSQGSLYTCVLVYAPALCC